MLKTSAIVVGAGHCGLAMSRCLADRSIDHVVFERGEVAHVVQTDQDLWHTRSVVLAPGASTIPKVPALHGGVPVSITTLTPLDYRNPSQLPDGGVLVVGASASGIQIAAELHRSGRHVTLAVGEHVRMPRTYRGKDILWRMDAAGLLDERYDQVPDLVRARNLPSMQLVGSPDRATVVLNSLRQAGCSWSDGWPAFTMGTRNSPAHCRTCSRWPTSSSNGCSTRSTPGRPKQAWTVATRRAGSHRPPLPRPRR
ncbi:MAG TPA: NAD(P)-binding domain-containing protein [Mycobacterium sp.]|nr:NAD(P)-binding domain-containing protein [Mycobacterium sp.]